MHKDTILIGIAGLAGSGKDTVADIICEIDNRFTKLAFAKPLKDMCKVLGLSEDQINGDKKEIIDLRYGCTPRHIMQTLGTEWGRDLIGKNIWINAIKHRLQHYTVISDVRFENEAEFIRTYGYLVHIKGRGGIGSSHITEEDIEIHVQDYLFDNFTNSTGFPLIPRVGALLTSILETHYNTPEE